MRCREGLLILIITGILLSAPVLAQTAYDPVRFTVNSFSISGDNPIGEAALEVLQPFIGEQAGLEGLSAAADALEREIIDRGFSFHRVNLPPQELNTGNIEFEILRFTIGAVAINGNEHFDEANILNALPALRPGTTPNTKELSRSLKLANNHASRNILLKFREGGEEDTIDADLTVQDRNPQILFLTLDNTGNEDTEEWRTTLGFQHGNLFNKDHAFTATLTFAPEDPGATSQFGISYHLPLYSHGANLDFLLSDSEIDSGEVADNVSVSGKGSVFGATYSRPLLTDTNFNHQWSAGFQNKSFENQIDADGSVIDSDVTSFPLELGYSFNSTGKSSVMTGSLVYAMNLESGSNNTDEDYAAVRPDAESDWSALRYELAYDRYFGQEWMFHAGLSGQSSSDLLISGEQFGVGGASTLRGFEERSVTGDEGHQVSLELWPPPLAGIRYLVFVDQASVEFNDGDNFDLSSYGVGLRWGWKQQLSISLDVGVIIDGLGEDEGVNNGAAPSERVNLDDDNRAHFNLIYRF